MLHHRVQNCVIADRRIVKAQLVRQGFLGPQSLSRGDSGALVQTLQLFSARRGLQILDYGYVGALIVEDFQRLARGAAHRVVVDGRLHVHSVYLPFRMVPQREAAQQW